MLPIFFLGFTLGFFLHIIFSQIGKTRYIRTKSKLLSASQITEYINSFRLKWFRYFSNNNTPPEDLEEVYDDSKIIKIYLKSAVSAADKPKY